ncbi:MAG: capsule biosynthesis protein [Rhodobacteraceae bacterium]|jgi:capsular polysaccharide transport system permease protein|uniref:Capsular polysaccharide transport system permease protein n=1 Tax=Salipiger profundus TaxID=1229727 RepID=A0A1U7D2C1_9RHOB|nr:MULTISPECIES: capsule biosynthesis protein [Salipiger]APX22291.1 capsular polysaccharide transport system permease protein [Salipiger profundus]MAB05576.1 capsule biosynthesis protein [Paracoccaceae bacterium]GGA22129.1 capsule polysaccharide transporter [Salipiger profundus]SFD67987.1 capsular polysaccharide transport system permease protein [Salipiger profundus]
MTTKPKAKKFRIRRSADTQSAPSGSSSGQAPQAGTEQTESSAAPAAGAGQPTRRPEFSKVSAREDEGRTGPAARPADETEAIRREGLTGRQLRMARRVAQRHGLAPTSDFDAVRLLRAQGIDPFQRANMLELVVPDAGGAGGGAQPPATGPGAQPPAPRPDGRVQLPQTVPNGGKPQLPSTQTASPAERRAAEIMKIQKDLASRRRRKMLLLLTRLAFFVFLPTIIAGYYFYVVATPMYSTKSEFLILKAENSSGAMGSLFSGTQFATNQDAIAVQSYLLSKDAMLRLDADEGFKAHFEQDWIDPIQRLDAGASNEEAYKLYKRNIEIGYDPTEGVVKMEILAADPDTAARFSEALIGYAEARVDNLSMRKRSNAVDDAEAGLQDAEQARYEAQERLVRLQQEGSVVDPEGRITALRTQISNIEMQLQEKRLALQALLDNARPNQAKVDGARGDVRRLETLLAELNSDMTTATTGEDSLAEIAVQIKLAEADLSTRDLMLQTALERLEQARRDADSQARYLTTSVVPVASEDPSYPRKFENTILAFLIFSGVYLMISLTASILREQVSS